MNENTEKDIVNFLVNRISPYLIVQFGSSARGNTHNESDIDLAFLSDNKFDKYELFMKAQELAALVNNEIDLIDLSQASTVFQAQIVSTGKVLYCTDEGRKAKFEMKTLKMYAKLNEERREILERINESGSIYE